MAKTFKILITGKNGYIGNELTSFFKKKGYDITIISRNELDLTNKISVDNWFSNKFFDVVLHTAIKGGSRLVKDDENIIYHNLRIFLNLFDNKNNFKKFINFGSGAEIFSTDTPYGFSKKIIREFILKTKSFYNIRIFNVFNEFEKDTRFIKTNLKNYINKLPIVIHENKLMDFFYMEDLCNLIEYYITNEEILKEIDCSYSKKLSLLDVAKLINNLNNYNVPIHILSEKNGESYIGNSILPIKQIGLEKGIQKTYNYLINNK